MSSKQPKKMKLSELQPKLPERHPEVVPKEFWDEIKNHVFNEIPKIFANVQNTIGGVSMTLTQITDPEKVSHILKHSEKLVKDTDILLERWSIIKDKINTEIKPYMTPEEALAFSFLLQTDIDALVDDITTLIAIPSDELLNYCEASLPNPVDEVETPNAE